MSTGDFRRPPMLWEQRLAQRVDVSSVGLGVSAASEVSPDPTPGDGGVGTEPRNDDPRPDDFSKPSTPTLTGAVQGIRAVWNGLTSSGNPFPIETAWIEVHLSTAGTGFTPGTATLKGQLYDPGEFFLGGLTAGTTYFVKFRGADAAGSVTEASDAASGTTATLGAESVSFNARSLGGVTNTVSAVAPSNPLEGDVWLDNSSGTSIVHKIYSGGSWTTNAWGSASIAAGQITALQLAAGAVTAGAITAGTVSGWYIQGGTITGNTITGGTISGGYITGGTVNAAVYTGGSISSSVFTGGTIAGSISATGTVSGAVLSGGTVSGALITGGTIAAGVVVTGYLTSTDVGTNGTTTIDGGRITSGTIQGPVIRTSGGGSRIVIADAGADKISWYTGGTEVYYTDHDGTRLTINAGNREFRVDGKLWVVGTATLDSQLNVSDAITATGDISTDADIICDGDITVDGAAALSQKTVSGAVQKAFRVSAAGDVYSYGIDESTTGNAANVRVGASAQLQRSTSTIRVKDQAISIGTVLEGVTADKVADFPASVDPSDVLTVSPTEFRSLCATDGSARMLGFIAEDVAAKFPWAAEWDDQGIPSAVQDRPILAALLCVVQEQQATIDDLTARIEALEG